jgi:hypothetical protein
MHNPGYLLKVIACMAIALSAGTTNKAQSLRPTGLTPEPHITLSAGDLTATFADNTAFGDHSDRYNGIASLSHTKEKGALFVPAYAGFNIEHVFGGDSLVQLFEPRLHLMELFRKSDNEVVLYQSATPLSHTESVTTFKLVPPHYIDVEFSCRFTDTKFFNHGYAGIFWASYINEPPDKKIYFYGKRSSESPSWIAAYSPVHGTVSTHRSVSDNNDFFFAPDFNARLASHFSDFRFIKPYYYGRFKDMVFAYLFEEKSLIRFSQSPTGGGDKNPAWDFQFLIPNPQADKTYSFKCRLIYKPFTDVYDVEKEYAKWKNK